MMTHKTKVIIFDSGINVNELAKRILDNEPKILEKHPPTNWNKTLYTDGGTGLGYNSLTSRSCHYNILDWEGMESLRNEIRNGYELYTNIKDNPLYIQCWANVMRKGEKIQPHIHRPEYVEPSQSMSGHLSVQVDGSTSTYYAGKPILNKPGQMTFFSSIVSHWTNTYYGEKERITIAFDIVSKDLFDVDVYEEAKSHWVRI